MTADPFHDGAPDDVKNFYSLSGIPKRSRVDTALSLGSRDRDATAAASAADVLTTC